MLPLPKLVQITHHSPVPPQVPLLLATPRLEAHCCGERWPGSESLGVLSVPFMMAWPLIAHDTEQAAFSLSSVPILGPQETICWC